MFIDPHCMQYFGVRLKEIRKKSGLSQETLAKELGISKGALSYYENGERVPDINFLEKVSLYYNVSFDYLMGFSNAMNNENAPLVDGTGLSEETINILREELDTDYVSNILDKLIRNEDFRRALELLECESHCSSTTFDGNDGIPSRYAFASPSYAAFIGGKMIMDAVANVLKDRHGEIAVELLNSLLTKQQKAEYYKWILNDRSTEDRIKELDEEAKERQNAMIERWKEANRTRVQAVKKLQGYDSDSEADIKDGESNGKYNPS